MDNRAVVERVMKNLGFETEPDLKRKVAGSGRSDPVATDPLNVKIKVRKKAMQEILSPGFKSEPTVQKLRSTKSNETIMSFDMFIVASDTEQKIEQKPPRKKGFGKWKSGFCIGATDNDEDEPPYMPDSGYRENISNVGSTSKSDDILRLKFPLTKNTNEAFGRSHISREERTFLGKKCKPGGCLDPPFGEDKYVYMPKDVPDPLVKKTANSELVEIDEKNSRPGREKKKSTDSDMLLKAPITPLEDSDSTLYLHKQDPSIHSITYPSDEVKQKLRTRISNEKKTSEIDNGQERKRDQKIEIPKYRSSSRDTSIISSILNVNKQDPSIHSITTHPSDKVKKKLRTKKTSEIDNNQERKRDQEIKIPKYRSPSRDTSIISSILNIHKKDLSKNATLIYPPDDEKKIARTRISSEANESQGSDISKYRTRSEDITRKSYDDPVSTFYKPPKRNRLRSDINRNSSKEDYLYDKSNEHRPQIPSAINHDSVSSEENTDIVKYIKSPEPDKIKPSIVPLPIVIPIISGKVDDDKISTLLQVPDSKEPLQIKDAAFSVNTTAMINDTSFMEDSNNISSDLLLRLNSKNVQDQIEKLNVDNNSAHELGPIKKKTDLDENRSNQKVNKTIQNIPMNKDKIENRELKDKSNKLKTNVDTPLIVTPPKDVVLLKIQSDQEGNKSPVTQVDKHESKTKLLNELVNQRLVPLESIDINILDGSKLSVKQIPVNIADYITHETVTVTDQPTKQNSIVRSISQLKIDKSKEKPSSNQLVERIQKETLDEHKNQPDVLYLRSGNNENIIDDLASRNQNLKLSISIDSQTILPLQEYQEKKLVTTNSQITNSKDIPIEEPIRKKIKDIVLASENQDKEYEKLESTQILKEEGQGETIVITTHAPVMELIDDIQQIQDSRNHTLKDSDPSSYKEIDMDATPYRIVDPIHQIQDSLIMPEECNKTDHRDYGMNAADKAETKELAPVNRISDTSKKAYLIKTANPLNASNDELVNEKQDDWHILKDNSEIIKNNINVKSSVDKIVDPTQSHNNNIIYTSQEFDQTDHTNFGGNAVSNILLQTEHKSSLKITPKDVNQTDISAFPMPASFDEKSKALDNFFNISVDDDQNIKKDSIKIDTADIMNETRQQSKVNRISLNSNDDVDEKIRSDLSKNTPTSKQVDIKHQSQHNEISQILDDHIKVKAPNHESLITSYVEGSEIRNNKVLAEDGHYKKSLPSPQIFKQDLNIVNLDLTFQSYLNNKNERFLKTVGAGEKIKRFLNDTITNVKSQISLFHDDKVNGINIPVDPEMDMTIQIKQHSANVSRSKTEVKLISKSVQTRGSEMTKTNNLNQKGLKSKANDKVDTLTDIYERELVPLQIMIRNLKNEIDNLVTQQLPLKKKTCNSRKAKQPRLLLTNKRYCGCSP